jgi:hypothetical protein
MSVVAGLPPTGGSGSISVPNSEARRRILRKNSNISLVEERGNTVVKDGMLKKKSPGKTYAHYLS